MSQHELPDPIVPAEVDLRDFAFMPLDVVRLRDSGLTGAAMIALHWADAIEKRA